MPTQPGSPDPSRRNPNDITTGRTPRAVASEFSRGSPSISLASLGESSTDTEYYSPIPEGYQRG